VSQSNSTTGVTLAHQKKPLRKSLPTRLASERTNSAAAPTSKATKKDTSISKATGEEKSEIVTANEENSTLSSDTNVALPQNVVPSDKPIEEFHVNGDIVVEENPQLVLSQEPIMTVHWANCRLLGNLFCLWMNVIEAYDSDYFDNEGLQICIMVSVVLLSLSKRHCFFICLLSSLLIQSSLFSLPFFFLLAAMYVTIRKVIVVDGYFEYATFVCLVGYIFWGKFWERSCFVKQITLLAYLFVFLRTNF